MLQRQLEELKQAIDAAINDPEKPLKLSAPDKELFGGMGYKLPNEPEKTSSLQNNQISQHKEELEEFEEVKSDPLVLPANQNETIISDADIVKAFYNIWVNLTFTLVENISTTVACLTVGKPSVVILGRTFVKGVPAKEYKKQLIHELNMATNLLFSPNLENSSLFLQLAQTFQSVAATIALNIASLFTTINSYVPFEKFKLPEAKKEAAKALFNALEFIFAITVKLEKVNQLKKMTLKKIDTADLSVDEKVRLIRETQANIFREFFGQETMGEVKSIFAIPEAELNKIIEDSSFIDDTSKIIKRCLENAATLGEQLFPLERYSLVISTGTHLKKIIDYPNFRSIQLSNAIMELEDKIIKLMPPKPSTVVDETLLVSSINNPTKASEIDLSFVPPSEKQPIPEDGKNIGDLDQKILSIETESIETQDKDLDRAEEKLSVEENIFTENNEKTTQLDNSLSNPLLKETIVSPEPLIPPELNQAEKDVLFPADLVDPFSLQALKVIMKEEQSQEIKEESTEKPLDMSFHVLLNEDIPRLNSEVADLIKPVEEIENQANLDPKPVLGSSWIELFNKDSDLEQNNRQKPLEKLREEKNPLDTESSDENDPWVPASAPLFEDSKTEQNIFTQTEPEKNNSLSDNKNDQPNEIVNILSEPERQPEINQPEEKPPSFEPVPQNVKNISVVIHNQPKTIISPPPPDETQIPEENNIIPEETIFRVSPSIKPVQSETYQEKTSPTPVDILLYTVIVILLVGLGAGIGFLVGGGIVGAYIGGILGAMASEAVIIYLMDKKSTINPREENQLPIVGVNKGKENDRDIIRENALNFNHDSVYANKPQDGKSQKTTKATWYETIRKLW